MATNFITQARIDSKKFEELVEQYRSYRREMNLQYNQLRKKTAKSIITIPKRPLTSIKSATGPYKNRHYYHSHQFYTTIPQDEEPKNDHLFKVKTVHVTARKTLNGESMPKLEKGQATNQKRSQTKISVPTRR